MSEEIAATTTTIAKISTRKNTERNRKQGTVSVKPWLFRIIPNNFK